MTRPSMDRARLNALWVSLPPLMTMHIEELRGTFVRRDGTGRCRYRSPLPLPFHYGACPSHIAPDGSGLDVILLGGGRYAVGDHIGIVPLGVADFQDGPDWDPKLIARGVGAGLGLRGRDRAGIWLTLRVLAFLKSSRIFAGRNVTRAQLRGIYLP